MTLTAEQLLRRFGVEHPAQIDLEAIAFEFGALVVYDQLAGCDARIVGHGKKAIITVNSDSSVERQRFSIGHELGHWTGEWRSKGFLCAAGDIKDGGVLADARRDAEAQANRFAADLILPDYLFVPSCTAKPITIDAAQTMAITFRASITACAIKLVKRGSYPGMAVCYSRGKREWFVRGANVPEGMVPLQELHYDTNAFELMYRDGWGKTAIASRDASCWIDRRDASRFRIKEQSIKVATDRVLTVLWFLNLR